MSAPITPPSEAALDGIFQALSDQTRRRILQELAAGSRTVSELVGLFAMSQPAVSKHLAVLEGAGLIQRGRDGRLRPCTLQAAPLKTASDWLAGYRRCWEDRFDRLEVYLAGLQADVDPEDTDATADATTDPTESP